MGEERNYEAIGTDYESIMTALQRGLRVVVGEAKGDHWRSQKNP